MLSGVAHLGRSLALGLSLGAAALACGRADPSWQRLAVAVEPGPLEPVLAAWNARGGDWSYALDREERGVWAELLLPSGGWVRDGDRALWHRPRPAGVTETLGQRIELRLGGTVLPLSGPRSHAPAAHLRGDDLVLWPAPDAGPPGEARLALWFERGTGGRCVEKRGPVEAAGEGLEVWPGERVELPCAVPAGSVLRFRTRTRAFPAGGRVTYRVRLDDEIVHEHAEDALGPPPAASVVVPLGPRALPHARLAFEVEGDPAATAFSQPVIGPAEVGSHGQRPWSEPRPDVVLFVADTFRADLLEAWGGDAALAPALNALAARSVRFLEARTPATWTLPAHASLFTGLWPPQHGAERDEDTLAPDLATLPELFAEAGYRTLAVTDALYVTRAYGLDQGFEWFVAQRDDGRARLGSTLATARAFVAEDDGRPLFLFVHTYRTHWPYRTGPAEDRTRFRAAHEDYEALVKGTPGDDGGAPMEALAREMKELYSEGARDLDAELGPWLAELESLGLFERGLFVFTSDHGEEFLENGGVAHGGAPHEVQARVPLFVFGGGEAPRDVRSGASLVDLCPTLAARCGLARRQEWGGADLFALEAERVLFSTVWRKEEQLLGVVQGPRKLLASRTGGVRLPDDVSAAYDLGRDPAERENVAPGAAWVEELARLAAPAWEALAGPVVPVPRAVLDESEAAELRQMGY